jgi:hypothetical protein
VPRIRVSDETRTGKDLRAAVMCSSAWQDDEGSDATRLTRASVLARLQQKKSYSFIATSGWSVRKRVTVLTEPIGKPVMDEFEKLQREERVT